MFGPVGGFKNLMERRLTDNRRFIAAKSPGKKDDEEEESVLHKYKDSVRHSIPNSADGPIVRAWTDANEKEDQAEAFLRFHQKYHGNLADATLPSEYRTSIRSKQTNLLST